jgi:hypothetical protein
MDLPTVIVFPARTWRRLNACWAADEAWWPPGGSARTFQARSEIFPGENSFSVGTVTCS